MAMGDTMIRCFSVRNFKNFKDEVIVDFSKKRDYAFNEYLIRNELINKMVIYGPNASGKTNLGLAFMDLTRHLSSNLAGNRHYSFFLNADSIDKKAVFKYTFQFGEKIVDYVYEKNESSLLLNEAIYENTKCLFKVDYETNQYQNDIEEIKEISFEKRNQSTSFLKYIYSTSIYLSEDNPIKLIVEFANNMLWFRSLKQNEFMGVMPNGEDISDFILNNHLERDFQAFLKECGMNFLLTTMPMDGKKVLAIKYTNYSAPFGEMVSTGTLSLWLFYYWMNRKKEISFVYLDEFDAFYHRELAVFILKYVNNKINFQSVITTHNSSLADNDLMRPDCYFILDKGRARSFSDMTSKVIRQAHNLEKMMNSGEFCE